MRILPSTVFTRCCSGATIQSAEPMMVEGRAVTTETQASSPATTLALETQRPPIDVRRTGRIFGWLFLGTFITSIPARFLFIHGVGASWTNMHFVAGDTSTASLKWGAVFEFGLIVTQIGTAVVLYPLARRVSETVALGYVGARIMESVFA